MQVKGAESEDHLKMKNYTRSIQFLLISRMLWDKGVGEYVEAARLIRRRYSDVDFCLLGFLDVQNSSAISRVQMDEWISEGVIKISRSD